MALRNNKERLAWWNEITRQYTKVEMDAAIAILHPDAQQVIRLHYEQKIPLKNIVIIVGKSMTTIRSHQCMGMHKLWKYFEQKSKMK